MKDKKILDLRKHKQVYLEWKDAFSVEGWKDKDDLDNVFRCVSIGFLVKEDEQMVTISNTIGGDGQFIDPLVIPKGMITKRRSIR